LQYQTSSDKASEDKKTNHMKKNILINGIIGGIIVSVLMLLSLNYFSYCAGTVDYNTSMVIGYASMIVALSLVFVGIRNYRDQFNNGVISFGKAFKIGILICFVAATIYMISWLIYYYNFAPDFMDKMSARMLTDLKASGASEAEISKEAKDMANMIEMSKNPIFVGLMPYVEILPVALIVTFISALILKRKSVND
jgi:cation transport ATPase